MATPYEKYAWFEKRVKEVEEQLARLIPGGLASVPYTAGGEFAPNAPKIVQRLVKQIDDLRSQMRDIEIGYPSVKTRVPSISGTPEEMAQSYVVEETGRGVVATPVVPVTPRYLPGAAPTSQEGIVKVSRIDPKYMPEYTAQLRFYQALKGSPPTDVTIPKAIDIIEQPGLSALPTTRWVRHSKLGKVPKHVPVTRHDQPSYPGTGWQGEGTPRENAKAWLRERGLENASYIEQQEALRGFWPTGPLSSIRTPEPEERIEEEIAARKTPTDVRVGKILSEPTSPEAIAARIHMRGGKEPIAGIDAGPAMAQALRGKRAAELAAELKEERRGIQAWLKPRTPSAEEQRVIEKQRWAVEQLRKRGIKPIAGGAPTPEELAKRGMGMIPLEPRDRPALAHEQAAAARARAQEWIEQAGGQAPGAPGSPPGKLSAEEERINNIIRAARATPVLPNITDYAEELEAVKHMGQQQAAKKTLRQQVYEGTAGLPDSGALGALIKGAGLPTDPRQVNFVQEAVKRLGGPGFWPTVRQRMIGTQGNQAMEILVEHTKNVMNVANRTIRDTGDVLQDILKSAFRTGQLKQGSPQAAQAINQLRQAMTDLYGSVFTGMAKELQTEMKLGQEVSQQVVRAARRGLAQAGLYQRGDVLETVRNLAGRDLTPGEAETLSRGVGIEVGGLPVSYRGRGALLPPRGPGGGGPGGGGGGEPGGGGGQLSWWMAAMMGGEAARTVGQWARGTTGIDLAIVQLMAGGGMLGYEPARALELLKQTTTGKIGQVQVTREIAQIEMGRQYAEGPGLAIDKAIAEAELKAARSGAAPWLAAAGTLIEKLKDLIIPELILATFRGGGLFLGKKAIIPGLLRGGFGVTKDLLVPAAIGASAAAAAGVGTGALQAIGLGAVATAGPVLLGGSDIDPAFRKELERRQMVRRGVQPRPITPAAPKTPLEVEEELKADVLQRVLDMGLPIPGGAAGTATDLVRASYLAVTQMGYDITKPEERAQIAELTYQDVANKVLARPLGQIDMAARLLRAVRIVPSQVPAAEKTKFFQQLTAMQQRTGMLEQEFEAFSRWGPTAIQFGMAGRLRQGEEIGIGTIPSVVEQFFEAGYRGRPGAQSIMQAALMTGSDELASLAIARMTGMPEVARIEEGTWLPRYTTMGPLLNPEAVEYGGSVPIYMEGQWGLEDRAKRRQRGYQQAQFGRQFAAARRGYDWSRSQMAFGHMQYQTRAGWQLGSLAASHAQAQAQYGWQLESLGMQHEQGQVRARWQLESIRESITAAAKRKDYADQEFAISKQLFEMRNRDNQESLKLTRERIDIQRQWAKEDLAYQKNVRDTQATWQLEDYDEGIRYATGRQKKQLRKQKERFLQLTSMEEGQRAREEQRLGVRWGWEDKDLQRQQNIIKETVGLETQLMELRKADADYEYELQIRNANKQISHIQIEMQWADRQFDAQVAHIVAQMGWESARYAANVEHLKIEMGWEEAQYNAQIAHLNEEYAAQIADIAAAQAYQVELDKIEDDMQVLRRQAISDQATIWDWLVKMFEKLASIGTGGGGGDKGEWATDPTNPNFEINSETGQRRKKHLAGTGIIGVPEDQGLPSGYTTPTKRIPDEKKYGDINIVVEGSDYDATALGRKLAKVIQSQLA